MKAWCVPMKTKKYLRVISAILVLVTVFQFATQTVFATSEIKSDVISEEKQAETEKAIVDSIFIGLGFIAGLLYIAKNVPPRVLLATIISMIGHDFDKGEAAGYILEIASSYIPEEDWETSVPHPISISEEKGKFRVYMDSRFLDKKFCIEYAQEIIDTYSDGKSFHGMDSERIAIEIYGHAFIHYAIYFIKATPFYIFLKSTIDGFYKSSDPIDVNYNESESRMKIFNLLWGKI